MVGCPRHTAVTVGLLRLSLALYFSKASHVEVRLIKLNVAMDTIIAYITFYFEINF